MTNEEQQKMTREEEIAAWWEKIHSTLIGLDHSWGLPNKECYKPNGDWLRHQAVLDTLCEGAKLMRHEPKLGPRASRSLLEAARKAVDQWEPWKFGSPMDLLRMAVEAEEARASSEDNPKTVPDNGEREAAIDDWLIKATSTCINEPDGGQYMVSDDVLKEALDIMRRPVKFKDVRYTDPDGDEHLRCVANSLLYIRDDSDAVSRAVLELCRRELERGRQ